jgi:hypothetical protein
MENDFTREGYIKFLKTKNRKKNFDVGWESMAVTEEKEHWSPRSNFFHDGEYGMPNVLCIIPAVLQKQWLRYDDAIDYVEESENWRADVDVSHVKVIQGGLYPWNGLYMDIRTGESAGQMGMGAFFFRSLDNESSSGTLKNIAKNCGFKSVTEAKKYMAPLVPGCIRYLCEYANVFTTPEVVFQLKPMLYVYWS